MQVYRLCRTRYAALDGEGARLYGGRWNRPGRPLVYASTSRALAALEYLIHVDPDDVPADLAMLTIEIPDGIRGRTVDPTVLPAGWERTPEHPSCQDYGDTWLAGALTAVLNVPSASVPEERNVLINPRHPDAARIAEIARRPFVFDPRLLA